jgi:hypothetical protein
MRRSGATINVLLAVGVVLLVGSVFVFRGGNSSGGAPATSQTVAEAFAAAYIRYLDGEIPLSQLPDASAAVLRTADGVVIPARLRAGRLTLVQLKVTKASGSMETVAFVARDRRYFLPTAITLDRRGGGWEVVGLEPPDMALLQPPPKIPPAPSAAQAAASNFALAYVDYREGVRSQPPVGLPSIGREIARGQDPLAHVARTHRRAHIESLLLGPVANGTVSATAQLSDGGSSVTILFAMRKGAGGWTASQFLLTH